jgi:hypothetical protein
MDDKGLRNIVMRLGKYGVAVGLLLAPFSASSQDMPQAKLFVVKLYAAYHGGHPDYLGRQADAVFTPSLLALIRRDRANTPAGDAPTLDGDPICDCQDYEISNVSVNVAGTRPGRAQAKIRFQNAREWRAVTLDLVATHGRWRVGDIHTPEMPSLVALLKPTPRAAR